MGGGDLELLNYITQREFGASSKFWALWPIWLFKFKGLPMPLSIATRFPWQTTIRQNFPSGGKGVHPQCKTCIFHTHLHISNCFPCRQLTQHADPAIIRWGHLQSLCFFIPSLPPNHLNSKRAKWWGQALFRSYGCFFAEFLGDLSLVRLGLLDLITCVGLRYGSYIDNLRSFSWKRALPYKPLLALPLCLNSTSKSESGFARTHSYSMDVTSNRTHSILRFVTPSIYIQVTEY